MIEEEADADRLEQVEVPELHTVQTQRPLPFPCADAVLQRERNEGKHCYGPGQPLEIGRDRVPFDAVCEHGEEHDSNAYAKKAAHLGVACTSTMRRISRWVRTPRALRQHPACGSARAAGPRSVPRDPRVRHPVSPSGTTAPRS